MTLSVDRLLATLPRSFARSEIARARPDLLPVMQRWSQEWESFAGEVGITSPSLLDLADAMADVYVHIDDEHGWDLLTPHAAREARDNLAALSARFPELADRADMLPVFAQDGDLYLLGRDSRVHAFTHDDWQNDGVVADSFDALLDDLAKRPRRNAT